MSYRNPRFSYIHTLRDVGEAGFVAAIEASWPFRSDTPRTRWLDGQNGALAGKDDDLTDTQFFRADDSTVSVELVKLERLIIPATHNFGLDRIFRFQISEDYPTPSFIDTTMSDDSQLAYFNPGSALIDLELKDITAVVRGRALRLEIAQSFAGLLPDIGEVWWTNVYEPTTGVAFGWEDAIEGTYATVVMESGAEYDTVKGEPKRRFTLRHEAIYGADLKMYDELRRRTLHGAGAFWYDHTDSGGKVIDIQKMDVAGANTPPSRATETLLPTGGADGGGCIEYVGDGSGTDTFIPIDAFEPGTPSDVRNMLLQFEIYIDGVNIDWAKVDGSISLFMWNPGFDYYSRYQVDHPWTNSPLTGNIWHRVQLDLENDRTPIESTLDHTDFGFFTVQYDNPVADGKTIRLDNFRLIDKTKQPVYVRMVRDSWRRTQESRAPGGAGGPRYNIEFEMIEVTT